MSLVGLATGSVRGDGDHEEAARKHFQRKNYLSAIRELNKARIAKRHRSSPGELFLLRASCHFQLGNDRSCVGDCDECLRCLSEEDETEEVAFLLKAFALWRLGECHASYDLLARAESVRGVDGGSYDRLLDFMLNGRSDWTIGSRSEARRRSESLYNVRAEDSNSEDLWIQTFALLADDENETTMVSISDMEDTLEDVDGDQNDEDDDDDGFFNFLGRALSHQGNRRDALHSGAGVEEYHERADGDVLRAELAASGRQVPHPENKTGPTSTVPMLPKSQAKNQVPSVKRKPRAKGMNSRPSSPAEENSDEDLLDLPRRGFPDVDSQDAIDSLPKSLHLLWPVPASNEDDLVFSDLEDTGGGSDSEADFYPADGNLGVTYPAFYEHWPRWRTPHGKVVEWRDVQRLFSRPKGQAHAQKSAWPYRMAAEIFGGGFARGVVDMIVFFGPHSSRNNKPNHKRSRPEARRNECTSECAACWAASLWQRRFPAWNAEDDAEGSSAFVQRLIDSLAFVTLMQIEATCTRMHLSKSGEVQLLLSHFLLDETPETIVEEIGPAFLRAAENAEERSHMKPTCGYETFATSAENLTQSDTRSRSVGLRSGLLLLDEISAYRCLGVVAAEVLSTRRFLLDDDFTSVPPGNLKRFWMPFRVQDPRLCRCCGERRIVKRRLHRRAWYMMQHALRQLHTQDFQRAKILAEEALLRRRSDPILLHVHALSCFALSMFSECLSNCARLRKRVTMCSELEDWQMEAIQRCVLLLESHCYVSMQSSSFPEHAANLLRGLHGYYEVQDPRPGGIVVKRKAKGFGPDHRDIPKASCLPKVSNAEADKVHSPEERDVVSEKMLERSFFECVHVECRELSRSGLRPMETWVETECAKGCVIQCHKRCWRTHVRGSEQVRCVLAGCEEVIIVPAMFMNGDNFLQQREKLAALIRTVHASIDRNVEQSAATGFEGNAPATADGASEAGDYSERERGGTSTREAFERSCTYCSVTLNSVVQWRQHVSGKRHRRLILSEFRSQLSSALEDRRESSISASDFSGPLLDMSEAIREAFGGIEQLSRVSESGLIVSKDAQNAIVVGIRFAPEREGGEHIAARTQNQNAQEPSPLGAYISAASMFADCPATTGTRAELAVAETQRVEEDFPGLGEDRPDPLLKQLRQLCLVPSGALDADDDKPQCDICWGAIGDGQRVVLLPCGHNDICASCVIGTYRRQRRDMWRCHKCRGLVEDFYTDVQQRRALKENERKLRRMEKRKKAVDHK